MALNGRVALFFAVIAVQLFCFINAATWTDFQKRHVLDPAVNPDYKTWNRGNWNAWLKTRILDYGKKVINSVVTSSPASILATFGKSTHGHSAGPDFFWTESKFPMYILKLVAATKTYDVFNCGNQFFLARLESPNRPMHFHGYSSSQQASGSLPANTAACTKIN